jgi:hypothetical protein
VHLEGLVGAFGAGHFGVGSGDVVEALVKERPQVPGQRCTERSQAHGGRPHHLLLP